MGRVGTILDIEQKSSEGVNTTNVKLDIGGGENITAPQAAPAGIDCTPLETDTAVTSSSPGNSGQNVVGYIDPDNASKGDGVYLYARTPDGSPVADIWLKSDGSIVVTTSGASIEIASAGGITMSNTAGGKVDIQPTGAVFVRNNFGFMAVDASGIATLNGKLSVAAG